MPATNECETAEVAALDPNGFTSPPNELALAVELERAVAAIGVAVEALVVVEGFAVVVGAGSSVS